MRWLILLIVLAQTAMASEGEIYKWILPDGSIQYSDRPPVKGAQKVELKPLQTYSPPSISPAPSANTEAKRDDSDSQYEMFAIATPADEEAIRDNAGNITITFDVSPKLVGGHVIDVFMDGRKVSRSTGAAVTLSDVSRGAHRLHAVILTGNGTEVARTDTVTFHLKRASALF